MSKLPKVHTSHTQEKKSILKLASILPDDKFILRAEDGGDYGVDRILEVKENESMTNIRSHIQIKSKKNITKKNGNFGYPVQIKTINYLLNSLNSLFLVFAVKEDIIYWDWVSKIAVKAKNENIDLEKTKQKNFTYRFTQKLDNEAFNIIYQKLIDDNLLVKELNYNSNPLEREIITDFFISKDLYKELVILFLQGKFEKIIAISKDYTEDIVEINALVSLCYYNIFNYDEALKYIIKTEKQVPDDIKIKKIKAAILCEKGIKEKSREIILKAKEIFWEIKSHPWGWQDHYNYGNIISGLGEYDEALLHYQKGLALNPDEAMLWKNISNCYAHQKEHEKELECLNKALELNANLTEALISKGITLGNIFNQYDEAIKFLDKAIESTKNSNFDNKYIYYWKAKFYNDSKNPKISLKIIKKGLDLFPGENYLENLKLNILISSWKKDEELKKEAKQTLEDFIKKFPKDIKLRIELLKIQQDKNNILKILPFIHETLDIYKFKYSDDLLIKWGINKIIYLLENIEDLFQFKKIDNVSKLFFENYDITITEFQHIEFNIDLYFSKHNIEMGKCKSIEIILKRIDKWAKEFLVLNESVTEILIRKYKDKTTEEQSKMITKIITTLPEILLIEFSRQLGWLLNKYEYESEVMDKSIQSSKYIQEWFELCIEPILKGAHNILEWTKNAL